MKLPKAINKQYGFTLVELLLVITIIATLAIAVFVALNPTQRILKANDANRQTAVENILSAIHLYINDNSGSLPSGLSVGMSESQIGTGASGCAVATGGCGVVTTACVNLGTALSAYLKSIPFDPKTGTAVKTNYAVVVDSNGLITVKACGTEGTTDIAVSR